MRAKIGYNAHRIAGTNAGFRVRSNSEVIDTNQFVRLRNADGQISDWLPNEQVIFRAPQGRSLINRWIIVYMENGIVQTATYRDGDIARQAVRGMRDRGQVILATKKITIEVQQ